MPARDGSGPMGQGSITGRGAGYCTTPLVMDQAVSARAGLGRGLGAGLGRGLARGARLGLGLGLGYGCRRLMRRNVSGQGGITDARAQLQLEKDLLQRRLDGVNELLRESEKD